jgi:hypothetical protein
MPGGAAGALSAIAGTAGAAGGGVPGSAGGAGAAGQSTNLAGGAAGVSSGGSSLGGNVAAGAGGDVGTSGNAGNRNGGGGGAGGAAQRLTGSIVPLYTYPTDTSWTAIIAAKKAHAAARVIAIVNPNSGPGDAVDATFTSGIAKLVVPIGYVSTNYTKRGAAAVNADVDKWRAAYPAVSGIFFDEQSVQAGDEAFYRDASSHAKTKGFTLTVGNPGTGVPDSYLDTVDIMLNYESAGLPSLNSLSKYAPHREHFAIIPYAAAFDASYAKSAANSVAYVYITNDDLPNPWDSLPSTFGDLLGALAP